MLCVFNQCFVAGYENDQLSLLQQIPMSSGVDMTDETNSGNSLSIYRLIGSSASEKLVEMQSTMATMTTIKSSFSLGPRPIFF